MERLPKVFGWIICVFALALLTPGYGQKKLVDPENYGGSKELKRLFEQELNYPQTSFEKDIGGRVSIEFEIDTSGKVLSSKTIESVGRDVDAEAIRISKLLLWEPAMHEGKKLPGTAEIKFKFNPFNFESIIMDRGYRNADYPEKSTMVVWKEEELDAVPEIEPKYESFQAYVNAELIFPEEAMAKKVDGFVEVFFVIEPNGRVSNVKIIQPLEGNCDVVALDLIHRSKWTPGKQGGLAVRSIRIEKLGFNSLNPNKALFHSGEQTPNR